MSALGQKRTLRLVRLAGSNGRGVTLDEVVYSTVVSTFDVRMFFDADIHSVNLK
jgi:hypothetical protein